MKKEYLIWGSVGLVSIGIIALILKNRKSIEKKIIDTAIDVNSAAKISTLHPKVRDKAVDLIKKEKAAGINLIVTSGLRNWDEQTKLYNQGRTAPGNVVTNAKAGESSHNFGTAIDVVPLENGKANWNTKNWDKIANVAKKAGWSWGGDWKGFKDKPHLEMNYGLSLKQMQRLYADKKDANGYIKIA